MNDCSQYPLGTRSRRLCEQEKSDLVTEAQPPEGVTPTLRKPLKTAKRGPRKGCGCGGRKKKAKNPSNPASMTIGDGPGSQLLMTLRSAGIKACDACYTLAAKMDEWGPGGCRQRIDEIVADILPRAIEWEKEKVGRWAELIPESVTEAGIRMLVGRAIKAAPRAEKPKPPSGKKIPGKSRRKGGVHGKPPLIGSPIDRTKLVTHMLYHFLPLDGKAEHIWRRHVEWIKEVRNQYNGRFLVGINAKGKNDRPGPKVMPPEVVKEALGGLGAEFFTATNDPKVGEGLTFPLMLDAIKTSSPDEVFFYGHTKGVTRWVHSLDEPPHLWAEAMFDTLFRNRAEVVDQLDCHGVTGPFRMPGGLAMGRPGIGPWWFFSGTFFAARSVDVFKRKWDFLPRHYGCVEQWPRLNFDRDSQSSCVFWDRTNNLYDADYWKEQVMPALEEWRLEHGILKNKTRQETVF